MYITGAQAIVKILEHEGVNVVFGYPGGAILPVYDSLLDSDIEHVLVRNEQAAAHAANGYARSSGKVGVCIATSGPGATNLVTGIATAYMDSIPIIAITGQVPTNLIGRDVFQEVDITGATEPFTKHNYLVKDVADIPRVFREAFYIAGSGRPGPVLIDIPKDVQMASLYYEYPVDICLRGYKPSSYKISDGQLNSIVKALTESERPLICVGGGGVSSNAAPEILEFAEITNIPVTSTLMGIGAFPESHPLSLGMLGSSHGLYPAKKAVDEADLLIVLGARMADRSTGEFNRFARDAVIVHIDIDPAEIGKNVDIEIPVVGDVKEVLQSLIKKLRDVNYSSVNHKDWLKKTGAWKNKEYGVGENLSLLNPMEVIKALSQAADKDTVIVTDVGQHQLWAGRYYKIERSRTFITSGGMGTMGYGLPAAIGVKTASPHKEVILITGDGSFQMSLPELATVVQEDLKIKIVLFNNSCLGMVRELQQFYHNERYYQVHMSGNPDFEMLAKAYGIDSFKVTDKESINQAVLKLLKHEGPVLGEFVIDDKANVIPAL